MFDLAYKKERSAARRRQLAENLTEEQALAVELQLKAAPHSLDDLLAKRRAEQQKQLSRQADRQAKQIEQSTKRQTDAYPIDAWLGWFDGSALPNPGRMHIGAVLQAPVPDGATQEISQTAGYGDSSIAEYLALHALLEAAIKQKPSKLVIYGDSRVVIDDVLTKNGKTAAVLTSYRTQARALMAQLQNVELIWIPRHRNQRADALSQGHDRQTQADTTEQTMASRLTRPFLAAPDETQ